MRLPLIDFLRGYSIFTIVLFHLFQEIPLNGIASKAIFFGGSGVHVFILCSGFGLCLSQLRKPIGYGNFLKKRLLKIYFPYLIVVLVSAAMPFIYDKNDKFIAVLSHVFLFKMFNENWITSFGAQFWFISMIIQFYLLFILLFGLVNKYKWKSFFVGFVISLTWATFVGLTGKSEERIWNSFFLQYLWEFILGMILAIEVNKNPDLLKVPNWKTLVVLSCLGIGITGITGIQGGIFKLYNDIPSLLGYLSLALIVYTIGTKFKWVNNFYIFTNRFSYEWFLIHMLVFSTIFQITKNLDLLFFSCLIALLVSYFLAYLYNQMLTSILYKYF